MPLYYVTDWEILSAIRLAATEEANDFIRQWKDSTDEQKQLLRKQAVPLLLPLNQTLARNLQADLNAQSSD